MYMYVYVCLFIRFRLRMLSNEYMKGIINDSVAYTHIVGNNEKKKHTCTVQCVHTYYSTYTQTQQINVEECVPLRRDS